MKIAVTDACIFIDIMELQLTSHFFELPLEVHTTLDVFHELYPHQQEILQDWQRKNRLYIHNISAEEKAELLSDIFPRSLSDVDKTVIYLARKLSAILLSSDKMVRNHAGALAIEYHGMLWIIDELVSASVVSPADAIKKLDILVSQNIIYQNNMDMLEEIRKRRNLWCAL